MNGIVVIIMACSIHATPNVNSSEPNCKKFQYSFAEEITAMQCMLGVQPNIAKMFVDEHPDWSINRITCQEAHQVGPGEEDPNKKVDI